MSHSGIPFLFHNSKDGIEGEDQFHAVVDEGIDLEVVCLFTEFCQQQGIMDGDPLRSDLDRVLKCFSDGSSL